MDLPELLNTAREQLLAGLPDALVLKITSLQRCVARAREAHAQAGADFRIDLNLQDAAILNVVRACDTAIDLAIMTTRARRFGIPAASREAITILEREGCISPEHSLRLRAMVDFRNLAIRQYDDIDLDIVERILRKDLDDLLLFAQIVTQVLNLPQKPLDLAVIDAFRASLAPMNERSSDLIRRMRDEAY
jgi:uncharacterized protein YutE (UPF0331/DUF86 family)